jgi:hypothetical protein
VLPVVDPAYHRALVGAELLAPDTFGGGVSVWRQRGLQLVQLLVESFLTRVRQIAEPTFVEHPFLQERDEYDKIFPSYTNVYRTLPDGPASRVLRPDNLHRNGALLRAGTPGPIVSVNGLLRVMRGGVTPLFRERYIWPAVQLNCLVDRHDGAALMDRYRWALESTFTALGLPVISVSTATLSSYGRLCHLTISCLEDGRPTVVATSYLMADAYRRALDVDRDVVDIGFTGKVLALAAMHHRDHFGLQLASAVAPTQVGLVYEAEAGTGGAPRWADAARAAGIRVDLEPIQTDVPFRRHRAERRLLRRGTPLVVGVRSGSDAVRLAERAPLRRRDFGSMPSTAQVAEALRAYDERLVDRARQHFEQSLEKSGALRALCGGCARNGRLPLFGWVEPARWAPCVGCCGPGRQALISERGRFY